MGGQYLINSWGYWTPPNRRPNPKNENFHEQIIKGPSSKKCQKSPQKRAQKSKLLFWVAQKSILLKKVLKKVNSLFWVLKIVLFKVTFIKYCSKKGSKKLLSQKSTQIFNGGQNSTLWLESTQGGKLVHFMWKPFQANPSLYLSICNLTKRKEIFYV